MFSKNVLNHSDSNETLNLFLAPPLVLEIYNNDKQKFGMIYLDTIHRNSAGLTSPQDITRCLSDKTDPESYRHIF